MNSCLGGDAVMGDDGGGEARQPSAAQVPTVTGVHTPAVVINARPL
ncbi:TPA: hypothetical protein ACNEJR_003716 [Escherichia coli]